MLLKLFLSLTFTFVFATSSDAGKKLYFRDDYRYLNQFNTFYKYHSERLTFSDAIATCKAEGAELWYPNSALEVKWMFKIINETDHGALWRDYFLWVGAHDFFVGGSFVTLSGKPVREVYVNWGIGQPDNFGGNEHCISIKVNSIMNDYVCTEKGNFVCKRSTFNLTQNTICETYDLEYTYNIDLDKCYKLHTSPMKWNEAYRTCRAEGAELSILNGDNEVEYLVKELENHPERALKGNVIKDAVHVGFHDLINNGVYLTVEGTPLSKTGYEKWAPGQPDNAYGSEHCGSMYRDGTLNDINCDLRAMFFCEKTLRDNQPLNVKNGPNPTPAAASGFNVPGKIVLLPDAE